MKDQLNQVFALIDAANAADPRAEEWDGKPWPKELLYSHRMTQMLARFAPNASEAVKIACRAQHIERWKTPRNTYPMTREGYFKWRTDLYKVHAERAASLMQQVGYTSESIERVKMIVGKKNIKTNPESQLLEDVAGLVFIEHYMLDFAGQKPNYSEEKWIGIIQKTWNKLSPESREFVLKGNIKLPQALTPLILKAINSLHP